MSRQTMIMIATGLGLGLGLLFGTAGLAPVQPTAYQDDASEQ